MMTEQLKIVKPFKPPLNLELVAFIEGLLDRAKNGEVDALAVVGLSASDTFNGWAFHPSEAHTVQLLGELELLKVGLIKNLTGEDDDE
jgi:hypothetical protein